MNHCKHTITLLEAAGARFYVVTHENTQGEGGGVSLLDADGHWLVTAASDGPLEVSTRAIVKRQGAPPDPFHGDAAIAITAEGIAGCGGLHGLQLPVTNRPIQREEL